MTQITVDQAYARKLADSLLSEFGLPRAQEYALNMMCTVTSEIHRKRWSEVLHQLNEISHPLRFRNDLLQSVFSGIKTATTRTSVKVPAGGTFWLSDMGTERRFVVSEVHEGTVSEIVDGFWRREGYADPTAFAMDLARIYPELRSDTVVYAHVFREVPA